MLWLGKLHLYVCSSYVEGGPNLVTNLSNCQSIQYTYSCSVIINNNILGRLLMTVKLLDYCCIAIGNCKFAKYIENNHERRSKYAFQILLLRCIFRQNTRNLIENVYIRKDILFTVELE